MVFVFGIVLFIDFFFVFIINSHNKPKYPVINSRETFRLLVLQARIPLGAWMSVPSESCVFSGRGLCDGPIPRSVCVCVSLNVKSCDSNYTSTMGRQKEVKIGMKERKKERNKQTNEQMKEVRSFRNEY